ncbi:helix-turn-helix domain-containing protein [Amycolatopsis mongoliensis]|uniref:Helix-turn-helix domain-containing protein n=1 Tax=Amycolatopsis mongoliensis TaxID=715475 RepID=A0A9Y2NM31_9PSEU|nr:helix-turn-helix domain-containing protein [Amycolatopsis sp. 4-36]WIY04428.1 helix-turn-helix domain-containing protein [Amycolatopsis sp. 4-36]
MNGHLIHLPRYATTDAPAEQLHTERHGDAPYTGDAPVIDPHKATYTVLEVAYLLNLSRGVTYQYVKDGTIPAFRVGRRWVISRKRFAAWLDEMVEVGA